MGRNPYIKGARGSIPEVHPAGQGPVRKDPARPAQPTVRSADGPARSRGPVQNTRYVFRSDRPVGTFRGGRSTGAAPYRRPWEAPMSLLAQLATALTDGSVEVIDLTAPLSES